MGIFFRPDTSIGTVRHAAMAASPVIRTLVGLPFFRDLGVSHQAVAALEGVTPDQLNAAVEEALKSHPQAITAAVQPTPTEPVWLRIGAAITALILLFGAVIYTAYDPKLSDIHTVSLHLFEILGSGFVGILIGEKSK